MAPQMVSVNISLPKPLYEKGESLVEKGFFQDLSELARVSLAEKVLVLLQIVKAGNGYRDKLADLRREFSKTALFEKENVADIVQSLRKKRSKLWKEKYAKLYPHIG